MRTPSLRRRVVSSGLGVFVLLVLALEVFVVLSLRGSLEATLEEILAARTDVAREVVRTEEAEDVPERLAALGVPAVVVLPDGERIEQPQAVPSFAPGPPGGTAQGAPWISTTVPLPAGGEVEVLASRSGVDGTLRNTLLFMSVGTVAALLLGLLLFRRAAQAAISPLDAVVDAAHRTAAGQTGHRLHADDPTSELGRMAVAYDQMLDELEDALVRTQEAEERTRRFVDDAAHQLRTPIASLRAAVEALLSTYEPDQRDRLMTLLVRETSRASRVLNDLLLMARLDAGRPPERQPVDLLALVSDEVERTRSLSPDVEVVGPAPSTTLPPVDVDPVRLREVVANLLDNARRHARSRVEATLTRREDGMVLRVDDDGPGVAPEARELVFERFATLDGQGGTGLGLPIARAIARAHGGELTCDDDGFELRIPTGPPAHEATRSDQAGHTAG
jgi:two-component system, OmpR family, sensor kinase